MNPIIRASLLVFANDNSSNDDGRSEDHLKIKPLIIALKDFYRSVKTSELKYNLLSTLDSIALRKALFRVSYSSGKFELFREGDAFEALDYLLTCMHTWSKRNDAMVGTSPDLASTGASLDCQTNPQTACFVHSLFHLRLRGRMVCTCGASVELPESEVRSQNTFAETINMADLLSGFELRMRYSALEEDFKIKAVVGQFFESVKSQYEDRIDGCVSKDQNENLSMAAPS